MDQSLDGQRYALAGASAGRISSDTITGTSRFRPELDRLLWEIRDGDVVVVSKYDRLTRSLKDFLEIVDHNYARAAERCVTCGLAAYHVLIENALAEESDILGDQPDLPARGISD